MLLALPPPDHLLIERDRGQFVPSRRRRVMANVRAERLLKTPAEPSPELRIPALQLKREWSPWPEFGSDPGNPREWEVQAMVAPNKLHHLFVAEYITSYPRAGVYAAPSLSKKRPDLCFNESQDGYGLLLAVKRIGP